MTIAVGILLALIVFAYIAIPLFIKGQADPLPDLRDPIKQDLEEEREALFRAIRELDARDDLALTRREQLRARYEAKAAKVLRSLDEREAELAGETQARPVTTRRLPYAALATFVLMIITAGTMSAFVLPRIGTNSTVTEFDAERLELARELQQLQRAVERNPNADTLAALADAYWQLNDLNNAVLIYERLISEVEAPPTLALRRLGLLALQTDIAAGQRYLEQAREADPSDLDTLLALGEVYFALGHIDAAIEVWNSYLAQPEGADDSEIVGRINLARRVTPLLEAVQSEASEGNLLALAEVYWQAEEQQRAADLYLRVLTEINPSNPVALSRIGQLMFFSGANTEAATILERAREVEPDNLDTLLFLGNAYFSLEQYAQALDPWQDYVRIAGDDAGRVPDLIAMASARLGEDLFISADPGQQVFLANCASCHGALGQGGLGPSLVNNPSLKRSDYLRSVVTGGKGMMPAFEFVLAEADLEALLGYLERLAEGAAARP